MQITNRTRGKALFGLMALAMMLVVFSGIAHADKIDLPVLGQVHSDPMINIMLGKAEMVDIGGDVSDVLVANPSIVDVMAVKSDRLYLVGANLGDTNIITLDANGDVLKKINVHVQMDTDKLTAIVNDLYPNETVEIRALTDQIVLTGNVSSPSASNGIARLVAEYAGEVQNITVNSIEDVVTNMLNVRGEQQVMLRVKIVEAARSALKDLGLETNVGDGSPQGAFGDVGAAVGMAAGLGLTAPTQLAVGVLNYMSGDFGPMQLVARALEEEGIINVLAEPNLTAISGEQAGFLAGGEVPIPTSLDQNGNVVVTFRPFGVSLNFRPVVMSEDRISMEMTTEVSSVSFDANLQLAGINVPNFNVRRAETTVELPSGGTLMIAGLLKSESLSSLTQIPGVKELPIVGDLMKSDTFSRDESEVIVMITPYLVKPFAQNRAQVSNAVPAQPSPGLAALSMEELEQSDAIQKAGRAVPPSSPKGLKTDMVAGENIASATRVPIPPVPPPHKQESKVEGVFGNYIRRTYGEDTAEQILPDKNGFGYMME